MPKRRPTNREDVSLSPAERWEDGQGYDSKLAWADHMRNAVLAADLAMREPLVVLDLGHGNHYPVAKMVAGMELDTHVVSIEGRRSAVDAAFGAMPDTKRPQAWVFHDLAKGIPLNYGTVDFVTCLEAMEHFVTTRGDVVRFFSEVRRVMKPHAVFFLATPVPVGEVVMHSHCHEHEVPLDSVLGASLDAGLEFVSMWNYRARPDVARHALEGVVPEKRLWPEAVNNAFYLPMATHNELVPGNAVYVFRSERRAL